MTTQLTLTDLEKLVLEGINNSDYGSELGDEIWSWSINCSVTGKMLSGVCSSLKKKGLIDSRDDGEDSTTWLTELGIQISKELNITGNK